MMLIILTGCMTSWIGVPNVSVSDRTEAFKTRKDVIDTWGAPDNVRFVGEKQYYTYVSGQSKGGGIGFGSMLINLMFLNNHVVMDTYIIGFDGNDNVDFIRSLKSSHELKRRIWPF
jgi:hypothetical protein